MQSEHTLQNLLHVQMQFVRISKNHPVLDKKGNVKHCAKFGNTVWSERKITPILMDYLFRCNL